MSTALKVMTDIDRPFDWLHEEGWSFLADLTDESSYNYLDDVYRVIKGSITEDSFVKDCGWVKPNDFKEAYKEDFPSLIAECLENLADSIRKGEIVFEINFGDKK